MHVHAEMSSSVSCLLLIVAEGTKYMTNRVKLWYVPVSESEKVMEVPSMPYKSSEQEAIGRDVYDEQKAFRSKKADMPASFSRDTPGAGMVVCVTAHGSNSSVVFSIITKFFFLLTLQLMNCYT